MSFWADKVKPTWKKLVTWTGVTVAAATGTVIGLNSDKVPEPVQDVVETQQLNQETIDQTLEVNQDVKPKDKSVVRVKTPKRITGGKYVRIVGQDVNREEVETDVGVGVVLETKEISPTAQCFVVMDAPVKLVGDLEQPDINDLEWHPGTLPTKISDSEEGGSVLWAIMLQGSNCIKAVDLPGYVGSDMPQFLASKHKGRFLKAHRKACPTKPPCGDVKYGDKDADTEDEVWAPVQIMGRNDLNWGTSKKGKVSRKNVFVRK